MKRTLILFITIIVATATANAQVFLEGGVGFRHDDSSETDASSSSLSISPSVGYWLNNKVAIGISSMFSGLNNNNAIDSGLETEDRYHTWSISVFGRYKLWEKEKFSILIETPVRYGTNTSKRTGEAPDRDHSASMFQVSAFPLVSYKLSERFDIVAQCNFLSLRFSSVTNKYKMPDENHTINRFDFGTRSSVFDSLGDISIGFVYNFKNKSSQR